jgi:hypothetical protein
MEQEPELEAWIADGEVVSLLRCFLAYSSKVGDVAFPGPTVDVQHEPELIIRLEPVLIDKAVQSLQHMSGRATTFVGRQNLYLYAGVPEQVKVLLRCIGIFRASLQSR